MTTASGHLGLFRPCSGGLPSAAVDGDTNRCGVVCVPLHLPACVFFVWTPLLALAQEAYRRLRRDGAFPTTDRRAGSFLS